MTGSSILKKRDISNTSELSLFVDQNHENLGTGLLFFVTYPKQEISDGLYGVTTWPLKLIKPKVNIYIIIVHTGQINKYWLIKK